MKRSIVALFLCLSACGGAPESDAETVVMVLVDELAPDELASYGAAWDATPNLTALAAAGEALADVRPAAASRSGFAASVLTGVSVEQHGLRSAHELGAERLLADTAATRLQGQGWTTLASVEPSHWDVQGLGGGFTSWHATPGGKPARSAAGVVDAVWPDLEAALESPANTFVFLHFGDLRGVTGDSVEPDVATLEHFLAEWRGSGGAIDEAFADLESEESLATRLAKFLKRRRDDPRRAAFERAQRAARLAAVDAQLGRVLELVREQGREAKADVWVSGWRPFPAEYGPATPADPAALIRSGGPNAALPHFADRAAIGPWLETPWSGGTSARLPLQRFVMSSEGRAPKRIELHRLEASGGQKTLRLHTSNFGPGSKVDQELATRGLPLRLLFEDPELFQIPLETIQFGSRLLPEAAVPELVAQRSPEWPENALVGPLLDLQKNGSRRMRGTIDAREGASVEVLLESLPADLELLDGVECAEGEVAADPLRPGAVWVRGTGPLTFEFPTRGPGARLAVLCRVDGQRVDHSRMRYLERVLGAPDRLELYLSAGAWLDPDLRVAPVSDAALGLQLADDLPLPESIALPSRAELGLLRELESDE